MKRRVRLTFSSDLEGLALPRSSLILLPELDCIGDICSFIRERFFDKKLSIAVRLELGSFAINAEESTEVIRDEDSLNAVVIPAANISSSKQPQDLDERSIKKLEKHRSRREKQRESRKLSRKTKVIKSKSTTRRSSGGVVILTDSSNPENFVDKDSTQLQSKVKLISSISEETSSKKSLNSTKMLQPPSFSRVSATSVKPLPRGHFRFEIKKGAIDIIPAKPQTALCVTRDGKSIERAKRLGSFFFKSPNDIQLIEAETTSSPQQADEGFRASSLEVCASSDALNSKSQNFENVQAVAAEMIDSTPIDSSKASRDSSDSHIIEKDQHHESVFEEADYSTADVDQDVLLETIAARGKEFFAPRTLDRFGLKDDQSSSEDVELQRLCESLDSVRDLLTLRTGTEIAFRRLEIVNWAPQMSKFMKYRVLEVDESNQEIVLVTSDNQEESVKLQDMHDVKALNAEDNPLLRVKPRTSVDADIAAALQAKREMILMKVR